MPHRFAVLIAARNEAAVIGDLIDSLKQQNYPAELIDIYVVADNCIDCTAEIAHAHGARVFERHDRSRVGKGFALSYLLRRIKREYDGYIIFDADNVVDRNYFREINKTFSAGYNIVRRETISYCPTAVFYDEQLTGFRQSVRQRMRWVRGYLQVLRRYGWKLLKGCFRGSFSCFDMLMNIAPAAVLAWVSVFVNLTAAALRFANGADVLAVLLSVGQSLLNLCLTVFLLGLITTISEWKQIR